MSLISSNLKIANDSVIELFQDILLYITDRLNLNVETIDSDDSDRCWRLVNRKMTDVCTDKMVDDVAAFRKIPISILRTTA